jgi:hypothetical protein
MSSQLAVIGRLCWGPLLSNTTATLYPERGPAHIYPKKHADKNKKSTQSCSQGISTTGLRLYALYFDFTKLKIVFPNVTQNMNSSISI